MRPRHPARLDRGRRPARYARARLASCAAPPPRRVHRR